ncbi:MAG: PepSY domain-containing protein [Haliea sp.]|nr:PepSY domain-containing protein [Haliea sp.]
MVNLDTVDALARDIGFGPRYRINLPQDADGVYTISTTTMTGDADVPGDERTVHVDRHSGEIVAEVGFADYSLMAKSMAVGIGVHQANMGWWNIAMDVLACAAVIFLCVSGTAMWWLRRPARLEALAGATAHCGPAAAQWAHRVAGGNGSGFPAAGCGAARRAAGAWRDADPALTGAATHNFSGS